MKIMKKLRETRKKARAISPVLAILLMIVITVAASLVTYAWVMGYLSFTTAKAGRAMQVQSVAYDNDTQVLMVYVQNVGEDFVTLREDSSVYVDGILKTDVGIAGTTDGALPAGDTSPISINNVEIGLGQRVRVRIVDLSGTFTEIHTVPLTGTGDVGFVEPPTVTRVQSTTDEIGSPSDTSSFTTQPQEGNLLVAIVGHRQQASSTISIPSISGWTLAEVYAHTPWSSGDRRVIAILYKEAGSSESTTVTITWTGAEVRSNSVAVILQEFTGAASYTLVDAQGTSGSGTTLPLPTVSAGGNDNILGIAGMVCRGDPGTVNPFTNSFGDLVTEINPNMSGASAFAYTTTSPASMQTTASWTASRDAAGMLALFSCD